MARRPAAQPPDPATPKQRTIALNCRAPDCGRAFKRRVRKGNAVTCPHCGLVQPGPARVAQLERLHSRELRAKAEDRRRKAAQPTPSRRRAPAEPPPRILPKAVPRRSPSASASPSVTSSAGVGNDHPPAPAITPAPAKRGGLRALLTGERFGEPL